MKELARTVEVERKERGKTRAPGGDPLLLHLAQYK